MKKLLFLAIIAIALLALYPDALALTDKADGSFISKIIGTIHSISNNVTSILNGLLHKLGDSFSTLMDTFKGQKTAY